MLRFITLGWLALALSAAPAGAAGDHADEEDHDHAPVEVSDPVRAPDHELVVRIRGVVCSFCAYGMEKALRKVDIVDRTRHRDGVLVDIDQQQIRLALQPDGAVSYPDLHARMLRGGYEPVSFHLLVGGTLEQSGDRWLLTDEGSQQQYALSGLEAGSLVAGAHVVVQARVEADDVAELPAQTPVPATLERLVEPGPDGDA